MASYDILMLLTLQIFFFYRERHFSRRAKSSLFFGVKSAQLVLYFIEGVLYFQWEKRSELFSIEHVLYFQREKSANKIKTIYKITYEIIISSAFT